MIAHNHIYMMRRMVSNCLQALNLEGDKCKTRLFILVACLTMSQAICQSQTSLIGVWKNTDDNVTLELRSDSTGRYIQGPKAFDFNSPYEVQPTLSGWRDQFQFTTNGNSRTIYAFVKELSSTQIKFIAFLTREELADDEIKNSGITLTKTE